MRTVRSSSRLRGGVPSLGGVPVIPGGVCTWSGGGVCTWYGGVPGRGVYLVWRGVPGPRGVYLVRGGTYPDTPPTRGQTHTCKNKTFATSLQTVIKIEVFIGAGGEGIPVR